MIERSLVYNKIYNNNISKLCSTIIFVFVVFIYRCEVNFGNLVKNPQKTPKKSQNFLHTKYIHFQKMNVANVYYIAPTLNDHNKKRKILFAHMPL